MVAAKIGRRGSGSPSYAADRISPTLSSSAISLDGVPTGAYIVRLRVGDASVSVKVILGR
jgi:hypothetical protein